MYSRYHHYLDTLSEDYISSFDDPFPQEPKQVTEFKLTPLDSQLPPLDSDATSSHSPNSPKDSPIWSDSDTISSPSTPNTELQVDEVLHKEVDLPAAAVNFDHGQEKRRAPLVRTSEAGEALRRILGDDESSAQLIQKFFCSGGCCLSQALTQALLQHKATSPDHVPVVLPDNIAFKSLKLKLAPLSLDTELNGISELPDVTVSLGPVPPSEPKHITKVHVHAPEFLQPHPPFQVYSAPLHHARELTRPGAEKRTFHFDIDVTDYPDEGGVDFKVGGAIGICPPNDPVVVDEIFTLLGIPSFIRDKPILLRTTGGRWPTIWGEDKPREVVTTRRELLIWCADVQSQPPTKPLLRLLAEYASSPNEKKILLYLVSSEGQGSFCDLRTGPHITLTQLLHAFPSSRPPLPALFSVLKQLMPRFYSLSNDPIISSSRNGVSGRKLIEMAVTVHQTRDWSTGTRTGIGSGFMERTAQKVIDAEAEGLSRLNLRIPLFRGLMANPLSREFVSDGPMVLIGAGVGMAPFRGFILNRLKNANCANKVWLIQGVRDSSVDELYSGELGSHERDIKKVVQSRKAKVNQGEAKYVQDEVRRQADVVWDVINAVDGRVFVCGSSAGMGEGVREALIEVVIKKGKLNREQAEQFWDKKREGGQFIEVSILSARARALALTVTDIFVGNLVMHSIILNCSLSDGA